MKWHEKFKHDILLQYLQFGFPLSLSCPSFLQNKQVINHFSARQFPNAVRKYIEVELGHGALVGPFESIPSALYHCSPLLSRPKPPDGRRITVDLSYPKGISVNDNIDRNLFDGYPFSWKLPNIDHIVRATSNFVTLF